MKKALKIFGIILAILIVFIIVAPFLFKGSLERMLKRTINENINATVAWEDLDLSIFGSFPDASLQLNNFSVVNKSPFEGDTLISGRMLQLEMGIMQLFKSQDLKIDGVILENTFINIKIDSLGNANYDVALKDGNSPSENTEQPNEGFTFELKHYEISDSRINYLDHSSKTFLTLTDFQHRGKGDLSAETSNLDTETTAFISFKYGETEYLAHHRIALDAIFNLDLKNQKYTFLENQAKINELPLTFGGFVQMNEDNTEVDLSFKTPSSDFKNFLAVIPQTYLKQINDVKTTGDFTVDGTVKGLVDETHIPLMDIKVSSDNASFKYPELPKTVENITIDAQLKNDTGLLKDTYLNIPKLTFTIDDDPFRMNGDIKNMTENPLVNMEMQGTLDLAKIKQVLPLEMEQDLSGIFKADVMARFDMESVDKEQYQNMDIRGTASLTNFVYDAGFRNALEVSKASLSLQPGVFTLKELDAKTGETDISASGNIRNLIPFLMSKQPLKGRFNVKSKTFKIDDFMASASPEKENQATERSTATKTAEAIKIPDFLDAALEFHANTVIYDNLELKNAKGTATIVNETISISNFSSDIFGGNIALSGNVSTKGEVPTFAVNLDLSKIDITQSFNGLEMFQYLVPIAKALQGSLNTKFELGGELTRDLSPQLTSLAGNVSAQVITAEVNPKEAPLLAALGDKVSFLDLDRLSLRNLTTQLTFDNGRIQVKPFHFDVEGVDITVSGTHGLDKTIDYGVTLDVPAKYLGNEVANLLQKIDPREADKMSVAVPIGVKGSFTDPQITLNTETAIKQLTQELIAKQKDNLLDKGKGMLEDFLEGRTQKDSTNTTDPETNQQQQNTQKAAEKIKGIFDGIIGGRKKTSDSTKTP